MRFFRPLPLLPLDWVSMLFSVFCLPCRDTDTLTLFAQDTQTLLLHILRPIPDIHKSPWAGCHGHACPLPLFPFGLVSAHDPTISCLNVIHDSLTNLRHGVQPIWAADFSHGDGGSQPSQDLKVAGTHRGV